MKRRLLCLLFAFALLLGLAACSGGTEDTPQPTDTAAPVAEEYQLTLPVYASESLHPALCTNSTNAVLVPLLYEGLFEMDSTFAPQMVLCSSYTTADDGLRWTFTIRSGVTWSNGTALTADDVAAALNVARSAGSRYQKRLERITSVTASGDAVTVTLSAPNGALPALLTVPLAKDSGARPAGTGPYVMVEGEAGSVLTLRSSWWQAGSKPISVTDIALYDVNAADDLLYAFDTREIDLVVTDFTDSQTMGFSSDYAVWEFDTTNLIYLGFRAAGGSPCADSALRTAIAAAIDRDSLVSSVFAHHAKAASLPVSPASPLYDAAAADRYDQGAALTALAPGVERSLKLVVCNENTFKVSAADRIAEQLAARGLTVTVEKLDFESHTAALRTGAFDLYLAEVAMTGDFDPTALVGTGGSLNYGGYSDATTDGFLTNFRRGDETGRATAASALYLDLAEKAPIAPLCFKTGSVLTQWNRMKNLSPISGNAFRGMENWTF